MKKPEYNLSGCYKNLQDLQQIIPCAKVKEIHCLKRMSISCLPSSGENKAETDDWILHILRSESPIFSDTFSCINDPLIGEDTSHDGNVFEM